MIVDANLLLYAVDATAGQHERARDWLVGQLNGAERVGLPWPSLTAFLRIVTNPRASDRALRAEEAWALVDAWLAADNAWIPVPTDRHASVLGGLIKQYSLTGNLIPDAHLAALAIEHGVEIASADTDFARFNEVRWVNPLAG